MQQEQLRRAAAVPLPSQRLLHVRLAEWQFGSDQQN